jgi:hypothetical protein
MMMSEEEKDEDEGLTLSEGLQKRTIKKCMVSVAKGSSDLTDSSSEKPPHIYSVVGTVYFSSDKGKDTTLSEAL